MEVQQFAPVQLTGQQQDAVQAITALQSPVIVAGGPGSGKTTVLVRAVAALVAGGVDLAQVVVLGHSRPGAQRLRQTILKAVGGAVLRPQITTIHGWCAALQAAFGPAQPPRLLTAPEQEFRVRELLAEFEVGRWPKALQRAARTHAFAAQLTEFITRATQLNLTPAKLEALGTKTDRADWACVAQFWSEYLDVLDAEGVYDYAELVSRTNRLLQLPAVAAQLPSSARLVCVDAAAEMDEAQLTLLAEVSASGVPVAAFADPTTMVYEFRGATTHPIRTLSEALAQRGLAPLRIDLDAASDGPLQRRLWSLAARLPAYDSVRVPSDMRGSDHERDTAATAVETPTQAEEVSYIASWLHRLHRGGLPWSELAVITRAGTQLVADIARGLTAESIPVKVEGNDVALAEEPAVRQLMNALRGLGEIATQSIDPDTLYAFLTSRAGGFDAVSMRQLVRELRANSAGAPSAAELAVAAFLSPDRFQPASARLASLHERYWRLADQLAAGAQIHQVLWGLWNLSEWPQQLRTEALSATAGASRANRDLDSVIALFDLANRNPTYRGLDGLAQFQALLTEQVIPADTARESDLSEGGVRVLTAHLAKGRHWAAVAVCGAGEGAWPAAGATPNLLEPERLSTAGVQPARSRRDQVCAERRSFLLACSRAAEQLLITCSDGGDDRSWGPSRFISELGLSAQRIAATNPVSTSLPILVGQLRADALRAELDPGLREGAAVLLGELHQTRDAAGRPLVPEANPDSWWGNTGYSSPPICPDDTDEIWLSPSAVASLLRCPRAWFLERRAGAGVIVDSLAQSMGTALHEVFNADAQRYLQTGHWFSASELHQQIEAACAQLSATPGWQLDAASQTVQEMAERYRQWRDGRPERTLLASELDAQYRLQLDGASVVLKLRVDRLEQNTDGQLVIVDFKTSKRLTPNDFLDQIACYELAVQAGCFADLAPGAVAARPELVAVQMPPRTVGKNAAADVGCRVASLETLSELPHRDIEYDSPDYETWAHARLAAAARTIRKGSFPAVIGPQCAYCAFRSGCVAFDREVPKK